MTHKLKLLFLRLRTCLTPTFPWILQLTWWSCSGGNVINYPPDIFVNYIAQGDDPQRGQGVAEHL